VAKNGLAEMLASIPQQKSPGNIFTLNIIIRCLTLRS
jgi:hypothetical protein